MPNIRMMLWVALAAILLPQLRSMDARLSGAQRGCPATLRVPAPPTPRLGDSVPQAVEPRAGSCDAQPRPPPPARRCRGAASHRAPAAPPDTASRTQRHRCTSVTDVLDVVINLKGGELDQADLLQYPLRKDAPNMPRAAR